MLASSGWTLDELIRQKVSRVENGFLCQLCGSVLKSTGSIRRHFCDKHFDSGKVYVCPSCRKRYRSKNSFSTHVYQRHKDWKGVDMDTFAVNRFTGANLF
jgi:uncharacterized C2H2 Zn-finger protein